MTNLIGTSGRISAGKDTVGKIIQYLTYKNRVEKYKHVRIIDEEFFIRNLKENRDLSILGDLTTWQIKKFAGALKQIASILTGIPVEDFEKQEVKNSYLGEEWNWGNPNHPKYTVRELLQRIGTEAIRSNIHPNAWVNALFANYKDKYEGKNCPIEEEKDIISFPNWIITDCRFENEADAIRERKGILIRVEREENTKVYIPLHPSETALDKYEFDYVIYNHGTIPELIEKVKKILIEEKII